MQQRTIHFAEEIGAQPRTDATAFVQEDYDIRIVSQH